MLTDSELTAMRSTMNDSLAGTAVIQSNSWVSDGGGGGTATWTAAGTVSCRIAPIMQTGTGEPVTGGRIAEDSNWVVTLPQGTSVSTAQRLLINGGTFNVTAVRSPRSYEVSTRVEVNEEV